MKFAVIGAGAIGGYLGAKLAASGEDVTVIARGANLAAIQAHGLKLIQEDGSEIQARNVRAYQRPEEAGAATAAGKQDFVLLALKAHQVEPVAAAIAHLCHERTAIVTLQNGIPWWYFYQHGGVHAGRPIRSADPSGAIGAAIDPARIIGCVVYPAANLIKPGVIQVVEGNRFTLGEPDGSESDRVKTLAEILVRAGFKAPITRDIRGEIWLKLWGNLTFNPISALTHATLVDICQFPATRELATNMMREAETVANKLGITFRVGIERRIAGAERVGAHKTSMLQDIEQGRPIELDALLGSVVELGALTETPTPCINAVYAVTSLLAKTLATQNGRLQIR
jgi:2-dehydropantoate 2-reductase